MGSIEKKTRVHCENPPPKKKIPSSFYTGVKMGIFLSCCGGGNQSSEYSNVDNVNDPEVRRKQMAEAAEARMRAQEGRGVKDPAVVRERQRKAMELERLEQQSVGTQREGGLRWQVN
ncbi:hypothetical protein Pcinc_016802 [Petrolisthes cinctipes]|uniref:Small VCP/p97-interacting protein n=1 Tax=Petrolisthes cinctipes TaxID=88211 RepID=A0AAE1KNG1_PETCI|nr:hypothetical protein Pcinc_016802 [Petrolisthes cinctipes]